MGQTDGTDIEAETSGPVVSTDEGRLVEAARAGDQHAFGQLFDQWFDRVHDLSRRIVRDDGIAGEVAQDAFLKAWTKLDSLDDPDAFGGWLLRIARNGSLNRLEKERRSVSVDDETMSAAADARAPEHDPLARMDQAARVNLVWDAAAALGPRDASVLDLHLRHGLTPAELAEELGCTPNNAHQVLFTMRKRLATSVRALVLWRAGHPTCPDLRDGLGAAGLTSFGAPMVKAIDRHANLCATCSGERDDRLSPAALFAAAPVVVAANLIKANAAAGLAAQGVPMAGSASVAAAGTATVESTSTGPGVGSSGSSSGAAVRVGGASTGAIGAPGAAGGRRSTAAASDQQAEDPGDERPESRTARRILLLAVLALLVVGGVALVVFQPKDDGVELTTGATTPTAAATPSTTKGSVAETVAPTIVAASDPAGPAGPTASTVPTFEIPAPIDTALPDPVGPPATPAPQPVTPPTRTPPAVATTTTAAPPPPTIDSFTATADPATGCQPVPGGPFQTSWNLTWTTTGANRVTVGLVGSPGTPGPPDGSTTICAPSTSAFELTASGPGGQAPTATAP